MLISVFAFAGLPLPKLKRLPGLKEAPLVVFFTNNSINSDLSITSMYPYNDALAGMNFLMEFKL